MGFVIPAYSWKGVSIKVLKLGFHARRICHPNNFEGDACPLSWGKWWERLTPESTKLLIHMYFLRWHDKSLLPLAQVVKQHLPGNNSHLTNTLLGIKWILNDSGCILESHEEVLEGHIHFMCWIHLFCLIVCTLKKEKELRRSMKRKGKKSIFDTQLTAFFVSSVWIKWVQLCVTEMAHFSYKNVSTLCFCQNMTYFLMWLLLLMFFYWIFCSLLLC